MPDYSYIKRISTPFTSSLRPTYLLNGWLCVLPIPYV